MGNDMQLMRKMTREQKSCEFSLRFLLQKNESSWKNIFAMIKLVKKGTRNDINLDYGEYVLGEKLLDINEGLKVLSSLYQENDKKRKLAINNYDEFPVQRRGRLRFLPSKQRHGFLKNDWPMRFSEFEVHPNRKGTGGDRELLKEKLPYYPNIYEAVIDFFGLSVEHFSSYGTVYAVINDYRARIESLKLIFTKAEVKLDSPEMKYEDLVVKVFAKTGPHIITLPDIYPETEYIKFEVGFQPDNLSVALLSRRDNVKIDGKEFAMWREEGEGVFIERPEEEILSLTSLGESQDLEYKRHIEDENKRNDFIESVIAFLNTNNGIILIGVNDDGSVAGTRKSDEDVQKLIHDSCDPPPTDVKIEKREISGEKVLVVEVLEGDDKPYQSKRDKNFYVRHNATDMKIERSELLRLIEEQKTKSEYPRL